MILLGVVLLVLGLLVWSPLIWVGVVLLVIGCVLALAGAAGRGVGGRSHWY